MGDISLVDEELIEMAGKTCKQKAKSRYMTFFNTTLLSSNSQILPTTIPEASNEFAVTFFNKAEEEKKAVEIRSDGDLLAFCHEPRTRQEIAAFLGMKTVFYAFEHYVQPLIAANKLAMTKPDKPKSKNQKYYTVL